MKPIAELVAERDRLWHESIHGGLAPSVRENARKKIRAIQKQIERLTKRASQSKPKGPPKARVWLTDADMKSLCSAEAKKKLGGSLFNDHVISCTVKPMPTAKQARKFAAFCNRGEEGMVEALAKAVYNGNFDRLVRDDKNVYLDAARLALKEMGLMT